MATKLNLDKLDLQIIQIMMEDAGISYADLGKQLFVSGGTIHVRIKKLQEIGIVKGTRLNVDLKLLGYDITAFVGIFLEKSERGPYCGVIGWIENNQALLSVGIRIFWSKQDGQINFGTGAGITWQSDPNSEWEETELKAKRLISIADGVKV